MSVLLLAIWQENCLNSEQIVITLIQKCEGASLLTSVPSCASLNRQVAGYQIENWLYNED
jgi:hypothetical protein